MKTASGFPTKTAPILLAALLAALSAVAGPPKKDLVLHLPLNPAQQRVKDVSGQHNHGKAETVVVPHSSSLVSMQETRQLTIAVWIKPNSIPHEFPVILGKGGNQAPGAYGGYEIYLNSHADNDITFVSGPVNLDTHGANGKWINNHLGEWIHVAFTINDETKTAKFFVNGQPTNDEYDWNTYFNSGNALNFNVDNNLYIGAPDPASNGNRAKFDGEIREVMVFNRALTQPEIQKICNSTSPDKSKNKQPETL